MASLHTRASSGITTMPHTSWYEEIRFTALCSEGRARMLENVDEDLFK